MSSFQKFVFYIAVKVPYSGGRQLFLDIGSYLADKLGCDVVYICLKKGPMEQKFSGSKMRILEESEADINELKDHLFFTPLNHLSYLLWFSRGCNIRISLYVGHPWILDWYSSYFIHDGLSKELDSFFSLLSSHNAAVFQDYSNLLAVKRRTDTAFEKLFFPPMIHESEADGSFAAVPPIHDENTVRLLWLGRLDRDKIYSVLNVLDNIFDSGIRKSIEFHIIGDGSVREQIDVNKYAGKIRIFFTGYMYGSERDAYIRKNADLAVSMGISAMDTASLGIPTVIPALGNAPFSENSYVYMFDVPGYSLGWDVSDLPELGCPQYGIEEIIDSVSDSDKRAELGEKCRSFCLSAFDPEHIAKLFLEGVNKTTLTSGDCMTVRCIRNQMTDAKILNTIRRKKAFSSYYNFVRNLNKIYQQKGFKKITCLFGMIIAKLKNKRLE